MQVVPYFYFNGNAQTALEFYQVAFESVATGVMRYKDQPSPGLLPEHEQMILHAELVTAAGPFYISDALGTDAVSTGNQIQINLNCDTEEQIRHLFSHLSAGGKVNMALENTFWGALFGSLTDQFGITWSLNYQHSPMQVGL